jgi:putative oxidoreductase
MTIIEDSLRPRIRTSEREQIRYVIPALGRVYEKLGDLSWVLVRGIYGYFFIPHGAQKLFGWFGGSGLASVAQGFAKEGLEPAAFWAAYIGSLEFFGGILMLIGLFTRPVAALFAGFMLARPCHLAARLYLD